MNIAPSISGILPNTDSGIELFKSLQELVRNSIEHARASRVEIVIENRKITLQSDGDIKEVTPELGFGLVGVKERLKNIGWKINFVGDYSRLELSEDT